VMSPMVSACLNPRLRIQFQGWPFAGGVQDKTDLVGQWRAA
jgi:hypothetical protein